MISFLGETQQFAQDISRTSTPIKTAVSWLSKSVNLVSDFIQQSVKVGMKQGPTSPYLSNALAYIKPFAGTAIYVAASETAYGLYEVHKANKENEEHLKTPDSANTEMEISENDIGYDTLLAQKAAYQSVYEQPLLCKMELSSTFMSTATTNVVSAIAAGALVTTVLPATLTGVTASLGFTLAARLIKKGACAYKINQFESEISTLASNRRNKTLLRKKPDKLQEMLHSPSQKGGHKYQRAQRRLKRLQ